MTTLIVACQAWVFTAMMLGMSKVNQATPFHHWGKDVFTVVVATVVTLPTLYMFGWLLLPAWGIGANVCAR